MKTYRLSISIGGRECPLTIHADRYEDETDDYVFYLEGSFVCRVARSTVISIVEE